MKHVGGPELAQQATHVNLCMHPVNKIMMKGALQRLARRKPNGSSGGRGNVSTFRATPSAMIIAAAVSAALPDVVSSCAATTPAMPYASHNFVARVSSSQPTWIDEVFTDIDAPDSFLD